MHHLRSLIAHHLWIIAVLFWCCYKKKADSSIILVFSLQRKCRPKRMFEYSHFDKCQIVISFFLQQLTLLISFILVRYTLPFFNLRPPYHTNKKGIFFFQQTLPKLDKHQIHTNINQILMQFPCPLSSRVVYIRHIALSR